MALLEWTADLETGDARIDDQHRTLVRTFNDLEAAVAGKRGREAANKTLLFLVGFAVHHFQMEEKLMEDARYPAIFRHKQSHHDMVVQASGLMMAYSKGTAELGPDVVALLQGWLLEHIQGEDRRLAEYLRSV